MANPMDRGLNPSTLLRRSERTLGVGGQHQTLGEERFYLHCPRYEEGVRRICAKSVILFRSDLAENLVRGLLELEQMYQAARKDAQAIGRPVADLEARLGAATVMIHLQLLSKIDELTELAETGTPIADVKRLSENIAPLAATLYSLESRSSVATTGDLNEEERHRIRYYRGERFINLARAVQLRREVQAAANRLRDGQVDEAEAKKARDEKRQEEARALQGRARERFKEIAAAAAELAAQGDIQKELRLDALLKQVQALIANAVSV